ncbi:MAG: FecR domain-containing protein [Duganella sp.]
MVQFKKCTAINRLRHVLALVVLCALAGPGWAAQVAGTIVQLSGPLMARKADGAARILSLRSEVESGDTLITEKNTYAMVKFIDNSEITLRPATTFKIEQFAFDAARPEGDQAAFSLVKGGLRSITGLLGKRNKEKFSMKTSGATIGIRGTTFIAEYVAPPGALPSGVPNLPPAPAASGARAPGLYVQVLDGMIHVTNSGGALNFSAGQFGYTPGFTVPPVAVPANPGMQFAPPPVFNSSTPGASATPPKANAVDCEVR